MEIIGQKVNGDTQDDPKVLNEESQNKKERKWGKTLFKFSKTGEICQLRDSRSLGTLS